MNIIFDMTTPVKPLISAELHQITSLANYLNRNLVVVDIGCRDGFQDHWLSFGANITLLGFDADAEECSRLQTSYSGLSDAYFLPIALGKHCGRVPFYITVNPGSSSIYKPDTHVITGVPSRAAWETLEKETEVDIITLESWGKDNDLGLIDCLKLDVQGAELDVLEGAGDYLNSVRVIEVEVEFNPTYVGQPLFSDVDRFLRSRGFVLWRLGELVHHWSSSDAASYQHDMVLTFCNHPLIIPGCGGQLSWSVAYYVHPEMLSALPTQDWRSALRDACLASAMGFRDLAGLALQKCIHVAPSNFQPVISQGLVSAESRWESLDLRDATTWQQNSQKLVATQAENVHLQGELQKVKKSCDDSISDYQIRLEECLELLEVSKGKISELEEEVQHIPDLEAENVYLQAELQKVKKSCDDSISDYQIRLEECLELLEASKDKISELEEEVQRIPDLAAKVNLQSNALIQRDESLRLLQEYIKDLEDVASIFEEASFDLNLTECFVFRIAWFYYKNEKNENLHLLIRRASTFLGIAEGELLLRFKDYLDRKFKKNGTKESNYLELWDNYFNSLDSHSSIE